MDKKGKSTKKSEKDKKIDPVRRRRRGDIITQLVSRPARRPRDEDDEFPDAE